MEGLLLSLISWGCIRNKQCGKKWDFTQKKFQRLPYTWSTFIHKYIQYFGNELRCYFHVLVRFYINIKELDHFWTSLKYKNNEILHSAFLYCVDLLKNNHDNWFSWLKFSKFESDNIFHFPDILSEKGLIEKNITCKLVWWNWRWKKIKNIMVSTNYTPSKTYQEAMKPVDELWSHTK